LKLIAAVFLIIAEAKTKKDDLMVNDYDLDKCEFVKTRILYFQVSRI